MKKYLLLVTLSLLSGCMLLPQKNNASAQLDAPKNLKHNGKRYYLSYKKDLGSVARYMYFEKKDSGKNWKSAVELLLDRNEENLSLNKRIELREKVYRGTGVEHFDLYEKDDALYGFVIYGPSAQYNDWQVNVSKGMDVEDCGFVQYQYLLRIPKTKKMMNMGKVKLIGYLKKYAVDKELERMSKAEWKWQCVKQE